MHEVDLVVEPPALNGLIGPNGSGKTTIFNVITGIYEPTGGEVVFEGQSIGGLAPYVVNQMGIARTFQNIRLFPNLTVLDNVRIAYHPYAGYGMNDAIFHNHKFNQKEKELTEKAQDFLSVFNLRTARLKSRAIALMASNAVWKSPVRWHLPEAASPG